MGRASLSHFPATVLSIAVGFSSICYAAQRAEKVAHKIDSPDGQLRAVLIAIAPNTNYGSEESRVEIRDRINRLLSLKDFTSTDSNHGEIIDNSEWTPDSQFFVFSTSSSGGHQPWQSPVWYYSRKEQRIRELSELFDHRPVLSDDGPVFEIIAPHSVKITTWKKPRLHEGDNVTLILNLAGSAPSGATTP